MPSRVLVIDDEFAVRDAFNLALGSAGYEVFTAASGEEGVEQARSTHPDLIFLDLRMPGMDGVETLRRLQPLCPDTPVYIITAFQREYVQQLKRVAEEGYAFHVVDKPIDLNQMQTIVRAALNGPEVL